MNSRERILSAFAHLEPDKMPIGFGGHRSTGISAVAYARLRDYLDLPQKTIKVYDVIQMLAVVDEDVLNYIESDVIDLGRAFTDDKKVWHDWVIHDGVEYKIPVWIEPEVHKDGWAIRSSTGKIIAKMPKGCPYFDQIYFPLEDGRLPGSNLPEIMEECMWSAIKIPGPMTSTLKSDEENIEIARKFCEDTDRAIIGTFGSSLLERGCQLFRHDNFYLMLAYEPQKAKKLFGILTEYYLENLEKYLKTYGEFIDIILFGDDLGMQTGPQISPKMYRELFKPYHKKIWRRAKELADIKVMLHSCGSIRAFLPDLIDAGIDGINPVQISAHGMEADRLKADFGDKLVFWGGGCDTQKILPTGSREDIRRHVRSQIQALSPCGGFIFAQVHNIQSDVPPENINAMIEVVKEYR